MGALSNVKLTTPTYEDRIPSTKQKVKIRPFRVGDEKTLLIASQSEDLKQMANALKSIVANCVEPIEMDKLSSYDVEYLFLKIRAKSVGETSTVGIYCNDCEAVNEIVVDLENVDVDIPKDHSHHIKIEDNIAFGMQDPDIDEILNNNLEDPNSFVKIIVSAIKTVYHGEEVIEIGESDKEELEQLLDNMTSEQFQKIRDYFDTMPRLRKKIEFECGGCGKHNEQVLEGLSSFF
jgi:hypothetical protein